MTQVALWLGCYGAGELELKGNGSSIKMNECEIVEDSGALNFTCGLQVFSCPPS